MEQIQPGLSFSPVCRAEISPKSCYNIVWKYLENDGWNHSLKYSRMRNYVPIVYNDDNKLTTTGQVNY